MSLRDLMPWSGSRSLTSRRESLPPELSEMEERMDRMFHEFLQDVGWSPWSNLPEARFYTPRIDISESRGCLNVSAELPGMDEKDVELTLTKDSLTLRGSKSCEIVEGAEGREWHRRERSCGAFHRTISLPCEVDTEKAEASFHKGILCVRLPKSNQIIRSEKHISIKGESGESSESGTSSVEEPKAKMSLLHQILPQHWVTTG